MKAIVSTPLQIFKINLENGKKQVFRRNDPEYYGISWNRESLILGHSNTDCYNIRSVDDYKRSEVGSVTCGSAKTRPFLSAPHQLVWSGSRHEVISTNTGRNCISLISKNCGSFKNIWFEKAKWDRLGDNKCGSHFNSVFATSGTTDKLYVVGHNWENPSKVVELERNGIDEFEVLNVYFKPNVHWAHNVWVVDDMIIVCNSMNGELVDIKSGEVLWKEKPIARGLAATKDYIFVGNSAVDGSRKARKYSNGSIYIIDRHTMKTLDRVYLNESGCINEVRIIDEEDEAHFGDGWIPFPKQG